MSRYLLKVAADTTWLTVKASLKVFPLDLEIFVFYFSWDYYTLTFPIAFYLAS